MKTVIEKVLKTNIKKELIYFAINTLFVLMLASMFPSIQKESEKLNQLLSSYPEGMLKAFGFTEGSAFFSNFELFIGGEHFSMLWPLLMIVFVITYASQAISGEIEKGTIDLLLAQPISRLKLYFAKYFSGVVLLLVLIITTVIGVWPIAQIFNIDISFVHLVTLSIGGFLFGFAILGINFLFASFSSTVAKPSGFTSAVMIVMYAVYLMSSLNDDYEKAKYLSFFHYFDYNKLLIGNTLDWQVIIVFITSGILSLLLGAYVFNRRDISV